jgi:threonine/homoserine/homoserine lactone efflux protein
VIVYVWVKAFVLGILVTAPVGPVGALVIRRTLRSGFWMGFFTGLGAAIADASFALLAGLGLSAVESFLNRHEFVLASLGALVLLSLGSWSFARHWREMQRARPGLSDDEALPELFQAGDKEANASNPSAWFKASATSFFITCSNPVTVLGFAATFAAFGFQLDGHGLAYLLWVVSGVLAGALAWWSGLAGFMYWVGGKLSLRRVAQIQLSTSVVILLSGFYCLLRALLL